MECHGAEELPSKHVQELLSLYGLQPELAMNILRADASPVHKQEWLYLWVRRLPGCCRQLVLNSVVEDSCLEVRMQSFMCEESVA
jgi:hypothetical protein